MLTEDYLMRYIRIAVAALAQMVGLKAAGLDQDALFLLDRTLEQIMGLRIDLIRSLSTRDLLKLLSDQDRMDIGFLAALGDLFAGEADLLSRLGRLIDSLTCSLDALALYLEVELGGPLPEGSLREKIEALVAGIEPEQIPDEVWFTLFSYDQQAGDLCAAMDALEMLLDRAGNQPDLVDLARDFYTDLSGRPDDELASAGLSRSEIQDALDQLEDQR
jgi:hypothetical protein